MSMGSERRTAPDIVNICFDDVEKCVEECIKDVCQRILENRYGRNEWRRYKNCVHECEESCGETGCYEVYV